MLQLKQTILALLLLLITQASVAQTKLTICTDTNFWYPFTYIKHQEAVGLHIDIISTALRNLGFEPNFVFYSWKECLNQAKEGLTDAVATASYQEERALYLNYPEGAAVDVKSPWRVTQVGYVVVTPALDKQGKQNPYQFEGDFKSIPQPVRVPVHYSVIRDLQKEGLTVKEGKSSLDNFKKLVRERTGSVVDVEEAAKFFETQPAFAEKLVIHRKPLNNKSYYLVFSKKSALKSDEQQMIWKEIAKVRNNPTLMAEFLKKY